MNKIMSFFIVFALCGCSIYEASTAPGPVPVEEIHVGSTRNHVMSILGSPSMTESDAEGKKRDVFEFESGYHQASKSRVILYAAGDVLTLGLAELVFWPMELAVLDATEGTAVVTYDAEDRVETILVTEKDGSPWHAEAASSSEETATVDQQYTDD